MVPRGKARGADVFAGAKGMCLRQGASRSEVEGGEDGRSTTGRSFHSLQDGRKSTGRCAGL